MRPSSSNLVRDESASGKAARWTSGGMENIKERIFKFNDQETTFRWQKKKTGLGDEMNSKTAGKGKNWGVLAWRIFGLSYHLNEICYLLPQATSLPGTTPAVLHKLRIEVQCFPHKRKNQWCNNCHQNPPTKKTLKKGSGANMSMAKKWLFKWVFLYLVLYNSADVWQWSHALWSVWHA